jgi:hypothetical protein
MRLILFIVTVLPYLSWSGTGYGLDDQGSILVREIDFFSCPCLQTGSGAYLACSPVGLGTCSLRTE